MTVHFIGMGGIGMSGIARLYLALGHRVQGSDLIKNQMLCELERLGAKVFVGHDASHVAGADWVVYSSAIPVNHPERVAAAGHHQEILHRAEALARLCKGKDVIAVTGTHGKTTTTTLIGMVLREAGRDPSVFVGGVVKAFGGNACLGQGREMVIEADESDSSFLMFSPMLAVITNIEEEHLDHFKDLRAIEDAYRDFIGRLPRKAEWFGSSEDPRVVKLAKRLTRASTLYGLGKSAGEIYATDVVECPGGKHGVSFKAWKGRRCLGEITLRLIGRHNVLNALAALSVGLKLRIPFSVIAAALGKTEGAARRFDVKYQDAKFLVVDDYAHHPTEIQKTLAAAKALGQKRIVALFQPHRYTRTAAFLRGFAESFADADRLLITDIYAASETPINGVSGEKLCLEARSQGHASAAFIPRGKALAALREEIREGDLVIALGAGDIYQVADELSDFLRVSSIFKRVRGKVLPKEPLAKHTTLRVGGPAEYWIEPTDAEDLKEVMAAAKENGLSLHIFGAGSNILAPDEGLGGVVIQLASTYFRSIWMDPHGAHRVIARAGVPNTLFIQFAIENGFGGCEFLSGIPGNLGGAVAMNAGSHGQSVDALLETVTVLDGEGNTRVWKREDVSFGYRSCGIKEGVILEAAFCLPTRGKEETQAKLEEYRQHRLKTQDLQHPSAGCMFKNPLNAACSSGKLIEEAGLKGEKMGQAQVSTRHANFIINLGGAKAADILRLIRRVQQIVKEKSGIELETEVKILPATGPAAATAPSVLTPSALRARWGAPSPRHPSPEEAARKVAVLAGGISCEREVSLVSGQAVYEALKSKGFNVILVDAVGDFLPILKSENVSMAFIALHGTFGEDGTVQRLLEREGILYTGSGPGASELAFDKARAQAVLKAHGIRVPDFIVFKKERPFSLERLALPCVIKPSCSGSSVGITIVTRADEIPKACEEAFRHSDALLAETYIPGRELTVGILGDQILPIVEVIAARRFYDYQAKYTEAGTRYEFPARLHPNQAREVREAAWKAYRALGCEVMARVDVILGEDQKPYVLEANTIPGLTGKSLLPKAALAAGIDFPDLCVRILEHSKRRTRHRGQAVKK